MAHLQNFMLPRWRARVMQRNTFLSISFLDEPEDYAPSPLRRSSSMPLVLCAETRAQGGQLMIDGKLEAVPFGTRCAQEESSSDSDEVAEASIAGQSQQDLKEGVNSDASTDVETNSQTCEEGKVKSLLLQIIRERTLDDADFIQSASPYPSIPKKNQTGRQWRPCKGARIRFRKLLDHLMKEFDRDPQGRKFKDTHYRWNIELALAEKEFREFVRLRLIEFFRQKDNIAY